MPLYVNEKYSKCLICDEKIKIHDNAVNKKVDGICPNGCTEVEFKEATIGVYVLIEFDLLMEHFKDKHDYGLGMQEDKIGFAFHAQYFTGSNESDWPDIKREEEKLNKAIEMIRNKRLLK